MTNKSIGKLVGLVLGTILVLFLLGGSMYSIDQGDRGVVLRNGKVVGTAGPGLNFKFPIIDSVKEISVQSRTRLYPKLAAYSADQQTGELRMSVSYRVPEDRVEELYSSYSNIDNMLERLVDRKVPDFVEGVFGKFTAERAITQRDQLSMEMGKAITAAVSGPIIVDSVQVENLDFSENYEASIEKRMLAEVQVQEVTQNKAREAVQAEIKVIQAQADADSKLADAKAIAEAITLKGNAEATAIRARASALAQNPALIELVKAENWDGKTPTHMIPGAAVPFMNLK